MMIGVGVSVGSKSSVGSALAAEEEAYKLDGTITGSGSSYAGDNTVTQSGVEWNVNGNVSMNPWRIGGKSISNTSRKVYSKGTVSSKNISKVVLTVGTASQITVNSLKLYVGTAAQGTQTSSVDGTFKASSDITFNRPSGADWSGKYFTFDFNITVSGSSNKFVQFKSAVFYYEASTPATGISIASTNYTPVEGIIGLTKDSSDSSDTLVPTITPSNATDKSVTWTSSNESIAVVDSSTAAGVSAEVILDTSVVGEAVITASANGGTNVTATITYVVEDPSAATLDHVSVTGTAVSPQYSGKEFNYSGLTFTAVYDDDSKVSITGNDISWDLLATGNQATGTYTVGATTVDVSVPVTVLENTLTVSISGSSLTKTSYGTNESWTYAPLTASGVYADTSSYTGEFTWSYSPATPADMGVGKGQTLRITAQASSGESAYVDVTVDVTAPTYINTSSLVPGTYYMKIADKYFTGSVSGGVGELNASKPGDAGKFTFSLIGDDTWSVINANGDRLGITGTSSKNLFIGNNSTYTFKVIDGATSNTFKLNSIQNSARYVACYNNADLRTYAVTQSGALFDFTLEVAKTVSGFSVDTSSANKNVLKGTTFDAAYAASAGFQARLNYADSSFDDVTSNATWTLDTSTTGVKTLTVTYLEYAAVEINDINVYVVTMDHLVIDSSSAKTSYYVGDTLSTEGLVIKGVDSSDNEYPIGIEDVSFSPTTLSTAGTQQITASYTNEDSSVATGTYNVTVSVFNGYSKVTSLTDLSIGDSYVVGSPANNVLMGAITGSNKYLSSVDGSTAYNVNKDKVSADLPSSVIEVTLLYAGEDAFYLYDLSSAKYLSFSTSAADTSYVSSLSNATILNASFSGEQISLEIGDSARCLGYNAGSPRFASYNNNAQYNTIALYKVSGSSLKTSLTTFANNSLKMNDPAYEGDISTPNCADNYAAMKSAYVALSEAEKNIFEYSSDYAAAKARMIKWAIANHETFTYNAETPFAALVSQNIFGLSGETSATTVAVIIISVIGVSALGGFFFLRKRKEI